MRKLVEITIGPFTEEGKGAELPRQMFLFSLLQLLQKPLVGKSMNHGTDGLFCGNRLELAALAIDDSLMTKSLAFFEDILNLVNWYLGNKSFQRVGCKCQSAQLVIQAQGFRFFKIFAAFDLFK